MHSRHKLWNIEVAFHNWHFPTYYLCSGRSKWKFFSPIYAHSDFASAMRFDSAHTTIVQCRFYRFFPSSCLYVFFLFQPIMQAFKNWTELNYFPSISSLMMMPMSMKFFIFHSITFIYIFTFFLSFLQFLLILHKFSFLIHVFSFTCLLKNK